MAEPVTCLRCGMTDPPPEQTCGTLDHFIGAGHDLACPNCGRRASVCAKRPCSVMRAQSYEESWDVSSEDGDADG